jgi:hypothetical protein
LAFKHNARLNPQAKAWGLGGKMDKRRKVNEKYPRIGI